MGYQNNSLTNGSMGVGATFLAIGKAGTMADLTVKGYVRPYSMQQIYCTLLDRYGREIKKMYWYDTDEEHGRETIPARYGWYDLKGEVSYASDPVEPGQGLWFTEVGDYSLVSSGEVLKGSYAVALTNGSMYVSNPMPATVKMGDVYVTGYTRPYSMQQIYCSLLDRYGREIKKMYWYDTDEEHGRETIPARYGWYDLRGETCYNETDEVKAGEALWFTEVGNFTLIWPKVLDAE